MILYYLCLLSISLLLILSCLSLNEQDQSVRIHKHLPSSCQMMLFSATYEDQVVEFAEAIIPNPVIIRLHRNEETLENIRQVGLTLCQGVKILLEK